MTSIRDSRWRRMSPIRVILWLCLAFLMIPMAYGVSVGFIDEGGTPPQAQYLNCPGEILTDTLYLTANPWQGDFYLALAQAALTPHCNWGTIQPANERRSLIIFDIRNISAADFGLPDSPMKIPRRI